MAVKSNYSVIEREDEGPYVYRVLDELTSMYHPHLADCDIVLVWRYGWKENEDGFVQMTSVKKATSVERQKGEYDVVVMINYDMWNHADFTSTQRQAAMDDAISQIRVCMDAQDEEKVDEDGRTQYRIAKAEFSGFFDVLNRWGMTSPGLHRLGATLENIFERGQKPNFEATPDEVLQKDGSAEDNNSGGDEVRDDGAVEDTQPSSSDRDAEVDQIAGN